MKCLLLLSCVYAVSAAPQNLADRLNGALGLSAAGGYATRSNIFSQEPISVAEAQALVQSFGGLKSLGDLPSGILGNGIKADGAARTLLAGGEKAARGTSGLLVYPNGAVVPADEPAVAAVKAGFGAAHLFAEINGY